MMILIPAMFTTGVKHLRLNLNTFAMGTKQTAIKWLEDNYNFRPYDEEEYKFNEKIWQQALQMEKEQIKNAFTDGEHQQGFELESEKYYNETYEKN
jgi:hypothetical protein